MTHVPHQLQQDFPEHAETLHKLKQENAHFSRIAEEYYEVNQAIHLAETNVEPLDDFQMVNLRKKRMRFKDEIAQMLVKASHV